MSGPPPEHRRGFVRHVRATDDVVLLDFTRDVYKTVFIGCLTPDACLRVQVTAIDVGYTIATTWTTTLYHYIVVTTTPDKPHHLVDQPTPPSYLRERAAAYFADSSHTR